MSQQYSYGSGGGYGGAPPPQQQQQYGQQGYGAPGGAYGQQPPPAGYGSHSYQAPPPQQAPGGYGAQQQQGGYGGYGGSAPPYGGAPPSRPPQQTYTQSTGPPPGADPQLWSWFVAVDSDRSGRINAQELQSALVNGDNTTFDLDTVKMLMSVFDVDRSGSIDSREFEGLFKYVQQWREVFAKFDNDRSGFIDDNELANALRSFGYNLNPTLIRVLVQKYITPTATSTTSQPPNAPPAGGLTTSKGVSFDGFIRSCVALKTLTEGFQKYDTNRNGWAQMSYENFLDVVLRAP